MPFTTEDVEAILNGRKTMARRIMKHQPPIGNYKIGTNVTGSRCKENGMLHWLGVDEKVPYKVTDGNQPYFKYPYQVGDIIWVRETWQQECIEVDCDSSTWAATSFQSTGQYVYKADGKELDSKSLSFSKWKPSIHMPKDACRLFLEVIDRKIERLQDITKIDAINEGVEFSFFNEAKFYKDYEYERFLHINPKSAFATLWYNINGLKSWQENPFVWVYTFKITERPKGFC
jgi:hypothetical protein